MYRFAFAESRVFRMEWISKDLFGGAITAQIPLSSTDASNIRQIPDNQEVFLHKSTDQSFIIEILEIPATESYKNAAEFHFMNLAEENECLTDDCEIIDRNLINFEKQHFTSDLQVSKTCACGTQLVSKFGKSEEKQLVSIFVAVFRLPDKNSDIVFSMYAHPLPISVTDGAENCAPWTKDTFVKIAQSLFLVDGSLFDE